MAMTLAPMTSKAELEKLMTQLEKGLSNDSRLEVRAPEPLMELVRKVAKRKGVSDAAYIRMALIEKLRRDVEQAED